VQRIPRYLLLLKELLRFTEPTHPDYAELQKALEGIKEVTEFIEAQTSKAHNLSKLASIQSRLVPANQLVRTRSRCPCVRVRVRVRVRVCVRCVRVRCVRCAVCVCDGVLMTDLNNNNRNCCSPTESF